MAGKPRGSESTGDVVRTAAIFLGLIALVGVFFAVNRPEPTLPEPVDYQSLVDVVREEYPYRVLAPAELPEDWRATSVDHGQDARGHHWRVGFLVGGEQYVGLEQTDGEIETYLRDQLADFDADGESRIGGDTWERRLERDRSPDRALVRRDGGVVTIVRGTTAYATLEDFVTWLR